MLGPYLRHSVDKGFTDKGHPPFLQLRAFTNKGPTIFTDKGFLQIRA